MARTLLMDVGAGTLDVLWYDDDAELHFKAVVASPVRVLAERANNVRGNLVVTGREMGGGPVSRVLTERAKSARVVMTTASAATIHHDLERVRAQGISVVDEDEAQELARDPAFSALHLADVDPERVRRIVEGFGVPYRFDAVAVCLQDHGVPPPGVSHLDHRHRLFRSRLEETPYPHALLHPAGEVPATFNRLRSAAADAAALPAPEVFVMDSGMAAILGATRDAQCGSRRYRIVLDVATSHTIGAALDGDELAGWFEYHTKDITPPGLDVLITELAEGRLDHQAILEQGGHGGWCRKPLGIDRVEIVLATGPRRGLIGTSRHPVVAGAPLGDNMMTGTAGLLEAVRRYRAAR